MTHSFPTRSASDLSILGLTSQGVDTLPDVLLSEGLAERLGARRGGRVEPPAYDPRRDDATLILNPQGIANYAVTLADRSEEHTSELQSLMRISYAVFCLTKKH